jgi:uncharacterized protein (TIGR02996 family)
MTDEHALLAAIAANPEDDTVRLAFADFVEENGDPLRAEFIRVQVELSRANTNDHARRALVLRNRFFLNNYTASWQRELPHLPGIEWGDFNRGLVEEVQAKTESAIVRNAATIFAEPAIHIIRLSRLNEAHELAALPELSRVRSLRLIAARAAFHVLEELFASPYLNNLAVLDLHANNMADAGARVLARSPLPALVELWLGSNAIGNEGGRALASSTQFQQLRLLDLRHNWITDSAVLGSLRRRFGSRIKL